MVKLVMNGMSYFLFLVEYSNLASIGSIWDLKKILLTQIFTFHKEKPKREKWKQDIFLASLQIPTFFFELYKRKGCPTCFNPSEKKNRKGRKRDDEAGW